MKGLSCQEYLQFCDKFDAHRLLALVGNNVTYQGVSYQGVSYQGRVVRPVRRRTVA
jgi:hypothetical protein